MEATLSDLTYIQLIFVSLIFLISFIWLRREKGLKLNEPPLVPYKYPIIGHTIDYYKDSESFIKKCQEEYGETFSLYVFGRTLTFVGNELFPEIFKNYKHFDFGEALHETFPMDNFMNRPKYFFENMVKAVRENLFALADLRLYTERVQRQLVKSIDETIGNGKVLEPPLKFIQLIIAKPIAATLVGEELSSDKELVNSFAYATSDFIPFMAVPPILSFINPILHTKFLIMKFRYLNNPFKVHRELIKRKITPVIERRLNEMKKLGKDYIPPTDILHRYIDIFQDDIDCITDHVIVTIFASVHTTSRSLSFILYDWVNYPQFHKEIIEEQEQLYKNKGNLHYSMEQIASMKKLDSLIRESLRVNVSNAALHHKSLFPFTFSDGHQVPKGRIMYVRTKEIHFDERLQGKNPNEFDALRHLENDYPASRIDKNYLPFGSGKHACPGRFFAINEIKLALHILILKYNIKKDGDEKINQKFIGSFIVPNNRRLIFEKRSDISF